MPVLIDGFPTTIVFDGCSLTICVKTLTPPEMDSGGSIDINGMTPTTRKFRLRAPKRLISLNSMSLTAAYDPIIYDQGMIVARARVGAIQSFTVVFSNGDTLIFYGFVEKISFQEIKEGEQPMVNITITPTLWNGTFTADGCPTEVSPFLGVGNGYSFRTC